MPALRDHAPKREKTYPQRRKDGLCFQVHTTFDPAITGYDKSHGISRSTDIILLLHTSRPQPHHVEGETTALSRGNRVCEEK
jgi:hypothetical protein